jgi:Na+-translocating ferredoxin:NAD+ oxidoreductase RnfD subunit
MLRNQPSILNAAAAIDDQPVSLKARRRSAMGSIIGHTGFNVARYHTTHVFGALFPLLAGVLVFGWRALFSVLIVVAATMVAGFIWRRIGARGRPMRPAMLLWLGVVIAMMLPANLLSAGGHSSTGPSNWPSTWPMLPIAGLLIVLLCWLLGGVGSGRFHPAVVVYLLLALLYGPQMKSQFVLQRNRLLVGDLLAAPRAVEPKALQTPWKSRRILTGQDAIHCVQAATALLDFSTRRPAPDGSRVSAQALLRDHLPPMEDFVLGAVPGGIGVTSAVAVIIGGLFLLYRGLIDYRIPLLMTTAAWIALIALPIPTGNGTSPIWHWFPGHLRGVGWATGVSLANYEILASPLLFTAFFLAGSPSVRPLSRKGRAIYALLVGALAAGFQLYLSVSFGSYLALLMVGLLTPLIDKAFAPRALV